MECPICKRNKLCFWCKASEVTVVACVECAIVNGFRLMEEVLEVKGGDKGVEEKDTRKGLSSVQNMWDKGK